jgi:hypothetical protein
MAVRAWVICASVCIALTASGCGSTSRSGPDTTRVTVAAYGVTPATTVQGSKAGGGTRACRAAARTLAEDAVDLLAHFGPKAAYPADLNYVIIRNDFANLRAHGCDPQLLGRALERGLTPKQRADLIADLPRSMGAAVRDALARAGSS